MQWWIYLVIIVGVLAVYFFTAFIIYLLMKRAKKKAYQEMEKVIPYEKEKYDLISEVIKTMQDDGRFLQKNLLDSYEDLGKTFDKVPFEIATAKNQNDFMILYLRKYLKEKNLLRKEVYQKLDERLSKAIYLDPSEKNSPYYLYNKKASRYNAFLSMGMFNIFRGSNAPAPTL